VASSIVATHPMSAILSQRESDVTESNWDLTATDASHDTGPPLQLPQFRPARLPDPQLPDEAKTR